VRFALARRDLSLSLLSIGGAALVIVAGAALPWASYRSSVTNGNILLRGGPFGAPLCALGSAATALGVACLVRTSAGVRRLAVGVGALAAVLSILAALSRISAANALAVQGAVSTAYGIGGVVSLVGSVAVVATNLVGQLFPGEVASHRRGADGRPRH
jgi:hypothetical protein